MVANLCDFDGEPVAFFGQVKDVFAFLQVGKGFCIFAIFIGFLLLLLIAE